MDTPPIDNLIPKSFETTTFAMGCFWNPDALFGTVAGVVRTRTGYAGGSTPNPSYWQLSDYIEAIQVDFIPDTVSYQYLLELFFEMHNPTRPPWKRQYASAVWCHSPQQYKTACRAKAQAIENRGKSIFTEVYQFKEFYLAEKRHQKYQLRQEPELMHELQMIYPHFLSLIHSTAAARINGYLYGYGSKDQLLKEIGSLGLSEEAQLVLIEKATQRSKAKCA